MRLFVCSSASQAPLQHLPTSSNAHCQNARTYALARLFEATRQRGLAPDALLPAMFPPDGPEAAHARDLCSRALAQQLAAVESGAYRAAPGRWCLQPTIDTPLALRGVALDKFLDDEVASLVHAMRKRMLLTRNGACPRIQVVDLGCGYATRPWTLPLSDNVHWFDVDLPAVLDEKQALLLAAGAQLQLPWAHCDLVGQIAASEEASSHLKDASSGRECGPQPRVPLRVGRYTPVVCHLLKGSLREALESNGWDPGVPTVWLAFALLYYLDERGVNLLMKEVTAASHGAPCTAFAGTIMNAGMVQLIQESVAEAAHQYKLDTMDEAVGASAVASSEAMATATFDPEGCGSVDVQDAIRHSEGVQLAATSLKFGARRGGASLLQCYGWDSVEEYTPFDVEAAYNILTVGLQYPQDLLQRVRDRHGHEPMLSIAVGRKGF